jgi:hypothetical protein
MESEQLVVVEANTFGRHEFVAMLRVGSWQIEHMEAATSTS